LEESPFFGKLRYQQIIIFIIMANKILIKRIFQRSTPDFIEYLEYFSNGDVEVAVYYPRNKTNF
jgi:hypothetical protein